MTFGSLFAGIGGFDLGLEKAGMDCKWQCEIDKNATKILEKYWPEVKKYNDVRQLTKPESVDLICGGFPCQDLSMAGNRAGLAGERSGLFFEMARIIDEIRPKWFVLENVPGLLSSKNGQDMQTVLETLVKLGYCIAYRVLDSKNFGVAQRRKRVFIIGSFGNADSIKVLFEPESIKLNLPTGKGKKCANARTVGILTSRDFKGIGSTIDDKLVWQDNSGQQTPSLVKDTHPTLTQWSFKQVSIVDPHTQGEPRFYADVAPTLNTNQGGQRQPCVVKTCNTKSNGDNIKNDGTSFTLQRNAGQAIVQDKIRRLIPVEYERLQGFPDGWTDVLSDTQRYKTLGNAVTVNVIEWIGKRIQEVENG